MEEPVSDFLYNHLYIYLSLLLNLWFLFVYKISPEKKIAQREEELHWLVMTDSVTVNGWVSGEKQKNIRQVVGERKYISFTAFLSFKAETVNRKNKKELKLDQKNKRLLGLVLIVILFLLLKLCHCCCSSAIEGKGERTGFSDVVTSIKQYCHEVGCQS
ncbi:hypothetical protein QL285_005382 [Trifolium repens]|nr:hypothetical protein QL285_065549 [Trifolium repens]KAK2433489.1 hypothetical protein QL285_018751 [Trifolium repens]KAK2458193.1 hypothetical protein QL285_005382 [Trifolium repens]